jgi:DNA invertase Pin-like site-specific DNA recombinase
MKVIIYLRYSSDPQEKGSSIERQTEVIDRFISTRPDFEVVATFIDDGYSASKGEHLASGDFGRILSDADTGKYRGCAMIVEKMDRFSRMDVEETASYVKRLTKGGVQLYLAASGRLVNPLEKQLGNIIVNVVEAWQAEDCVKNLTANVKRGWQRIMKEAANGRVLTRRVPKWLRVVDRTYNGAKIINPGRIVEVPDKVAVVREMFRLAARGVGSENTSRALNGKILSRGWIVTTLRNRAVLGEFQPGGSGEVIQNYFPQIVSQTEFDDAGRQIDAKRIHSHYVGGNKRNSATADNLFSGFLFDRDFDHVRSMHFQKVARGTYVMSPTDLKRMKSNRIRYDKLEKAILGFFLNVIWPDIARESESDEYKAAKAALEAKLRLEDAISREIASNTQAMVVRTWTLGGFS